MNDETENEIRERETKKCRADDDRRSEPFTLRSFNNCIQTIAAGCRRPAVAKLNLDYSSYPVHPAYLHDVAHRVQSPEK